MKFLFVTVLVVFSQLGSCGWAPTDAAFQASCLNVHNQWRSDVAQGQVNNQPSASNMRKMQWNSALAKVAYDYSEWLCNNDKFEHNNNRVSQAANNGYQGALIGNSYQTSVGENLAWYSPGSDTLALVEAMVKMWYDEHVDYTYGQCCPGNFGAYGHYSQGVWDDSYLLGCGYFSCNNGRYLTCNYGVAGNYQQQTPYDQGSSCSQCPNGWVCANGLCTQSAPAPAPSPTPKPTTPHPTPKPTTPHPTPPPSPTPAPTTPAPTPTPAPTDQSSACTGGCFRWTINMPVKFENGDTCLQWAMAFSTMGSYNLHMDRYRNCVMTPNGYGNHDKVSITWYINDSERATIWGWINNNDWYGAIHNKMNIIRNNGAAGSMQNPGVKPEEGKSGQPECEGTECQKEESKTPTGLIIGVVIASVCLCSLILGGFFWFHRNKAQNTAYFELQGQEKDTNYAPPSQP